MNQQIPTMPCAQCDGSGRVKLASVLLKTLHRFTGRRGGLRAEDIHLPEDGTTINAINNRLEKLRKMGFLTRERDGKYWRYKRTYTKATDVPRSPANAGKPGDEANSRPSQNFDPE